MALAKACAEGRSEGQQGQGNLLNTVFPHVGGPTFSKQEGHRPRGVTPQCPALRSAGALRPEVCCSGHGCHPRAVQQPEHGDPAWAGSPLRLPPALPTLKALSPRSPQAGVGSHTHLLQCCLRCFL